MVAFKGADSEFDSCFLKCRRKISFWAKLVLKLQTVQIKLCTIGFSRVLIHNMIIVFLNSIPKTSFFGKTLSLNFKVLFVLNEC